MSVSIQDSRRFAFFIIDNEVTDCYNLSSNALLTYIAISRCANGGSCSYSAMFLASKVNISRPTFWRGIAELKKAGLVAVEETEGKNTKFTLLEVKKVFRNPTVEPDSIRVTPSETCIPQSQVPDSIRVTKNTNNKTTSNPTEKKTRRSREEIFSPYSPDTKTLVNEILEMWPEKRPGNNSPINPDVPLLASRLDELLKNPAITKSLLVGSVKRYLKEAKLWLHAPEYFFGPGKAGSDGPPWRPYAKMEYHEQHRQLSMAATAGATQ